MNHIPGDLGTWVTLFVDMVGSTELKYKYADRIVNTIIARLSRAVEDGRTGTREGDNAKFTGDGAMLIFRRTPNGCGAALSVAENIFLAIERENLRLDLPPVRVRMGITTGQSMKLPGLFHTELVGRPVDLAARLCAEADPDTILLDKDTKAGATGDRYRFPDHRFVICKRRLALKGVPINRDTSDEFYYLRLNRLLNSTFPDTFTKGLLALFPDRAQLQRDWSPARLIHRVVPGSTILVAGRTLTHWTHFRSEMRHAALVHDVHFQLLLSSEGACRFLLPAQHVDVRTDLPLAVECFTDLAVSDPKHFEVRISDHLIIDGIVCAHVRPPGDTTDSDGKLVVIQDINAGTAANKSSQLWGCNCVPHGENMDKCPAHGLFERTEHIFALATTPSAVPL